MPLFGRISFSRCHLHARSKLVWIRILLNIINLQNFVNVEKFKVPRSSLTIYLQIVFSLNFIFIMTRTSVELGDVTPHNVKQLKTLNTVVFPVSYKDKFYIDVLEAGELAKLAYYNDIVVGAVCCRIDTSENQRRLYIMTLGCLYPYRRLGIGTILFHHILNYAEKDGNFDSIFLHVQINNDGAIAFYKKFGFEIVETKKLYYKRIEPSDAHVLQKTLKKTGNNNNTDEPQSNGIDKTDKKDKKA